MKMSPTNTLIGIQHIPIDLLYVGMIVVIKNYPEFTKGRVISVNGYKAQIEFELPIFGRTTHNWDIRDCRHTSIIVGKCKRLKALHNKLRMDGLI